MLLQKMLKKKTVRDSREATGKKKESNSNHRNSTSSSKSVDCQGYDHPLGLTPEQQNSLGTDPKKWSRDQKMISLVKWALAEKDSVIEDFVLFMDELSRANTNYLTTYYRACKVLKDIRAYRKAEAQRRLGLASLFSQRFLKEDAKEECHFIAFQLRRAVSDKIDELVTAFENSATNQDTLQNTPAPDPKLFDDIWSKTVDFLADTFPEYLCSKRYRSLMEAVHIRYHSRFLL